MVEHLITRIEQGAQGEIDGLADAHGHEHLGLRLVGHAEVFLDVGGDLGAQLGQAQVGGVAGVALFERVHGGLADVPGRDEIRLADAQADDPAHGLDDFKEIADARARDALDVAGDG